MTTATAQNTQNAALSANVIITGVVSGIVAGGIFGVQMLLAGMMPMIASMIGSESVVVGFIVHLLISAFIGGTFGVIATYLPRTLSVQVIAGLAYGIVWWVLGALIIMPLVLGMGEMVFVVGEMQIGSLIGHSVFGLTMGAVNYVFVQLDR